MQLIAMSSAESSLQTSHSGVFHKSTTYKNVGWLDPLGSSRAAILDDGEYPGIEGASVNAG